MAVPRLNLLQFFAAGVVLFGLLVSGQTDCEWDCGWLNGQALQTFSDFTGPGGPSGFKTEIARLDTATGNYISLTNYPGLDWINAAVYWRDNVTTPGVPMDKLFAVEAHEYGTEQNPDRKNYLVQLCPQTNTFIRRAVLPSRADNKRYYVASSSNDGSMWLSAGGNTDLVNIDFASVSDTTLSSISVNDVSVYNPVDISTDGSVADLAWYEPCEVFVGLSKSSTLGDLKVMLFDYDSQSATTHPFSVDGPKIDHKGYGACYTFAEGTAVLCSGNGDLDNEVNGALYQIEMDPNTCLPTEVNFRVVTQPGAATDGTTCRFPGTLPCVPAYVSAPTADVCALNRIMGANQPSDGGSGQWTLIEAESTFMSSDISFSDVNDPNAVVTADLAGVAKLRWTLTAPLCSDSSADIRVTFGYSCCYENEYVNSNNACLSCPGALVSAAGADPAGPPTQCVWPICPDNSVWLALEYRCRCVTGYTNDPVWTGASYTNSCKKICKFCTS